jgi:CcmD family protein
MEPLLLFGYTGIFVLLFAYLVRLQRRVTSLRQQVEDLNQ